MRLLKARYFLKGFVSSASLVIVGIMAFGIYELYNENQELKQKLNGNLTGFEGLPTASTNKKDGGIYDRD
jgi:hypothetical protein